MKYYPKTILLILTIVLLLSFASASATLNQAHNVRVSCAGFNCSLLNITILFPNSTIFINNQPMTNNVYNANYSVIPKVNGQYDYFYSDGTNSSKSYFITTTTGNELNTSQGILYLLMGIVLIFLFILSLYGGMVIPFQNQRNQNSEVVSINYKKYLKIFCWGLSYMFLVAIVFVIWNLVYAYAQWENIGKFFHYLYRLLIALALPTLIGIWLMTIINYFNDKKIEGFIKRTGLPYNAG